MKSSKVLGAVVALVAGLFLVGEAWAGFGDFFFGRKKHVENCPVKMVQTEGKNCFSCHGGSASQDLMPHAEVCEKGAKRNVYFLRICPVMAVVRSINLSRKAESLQETE
jgi:hypothetical protein